MALITPIYDPLTLEFATVGKFLGDGKSYLAVPLRGAVNFYELGPESSPLVHTLTVSDLGAEIKLFTYKSSDNTDLVGFIDYKNHESNGMPTVYGYLKGSEKKSLLRFNTPPDVASNYKYAPFAASKIVPELFAALDMQGSCIKVYSKGSERGTHQVDKKAQHQLFWIGETDLAIISKTQQHYNVQIIATGKVHRGKFKLLSTLKFPLSEPVQSVNLVSLEPKFKSKALILCSTYGWIIDFSKKEADVVKKIKIRNTDRSAQFSFLEFAKPTGSAVFVSPYECIAFDGSSFGKHGGYSNRKDMLALGGKFFTYQKSNRMRSILSVSVSNPLAVAAQTDINFDYSFGSDMQLLYSYNDISGTVYVSKLKGFASGNSLKMQRRCLTYTGSQLLSTESIEPVSNAFFAGEDLVLISSPEFGTKVAKLGDKVEFVPSWYNNLETVYANSQVQITKTGIYTSKGSVENPLSGEITMGTVYKDQIVVANPTQIAYLSTDLQTLKKETKYLVMFLFNGGFCTPDSVVLDSGVEKKVANITCGCIHNGKLFVGTFKNELSVADLADENLEFTSITMRSGVESLESYDFGVVITTTRGRYLYDSSEFLYLGNEGELVVFDQTLKRCLMLANGVLQLKTGPKHAIFTEWVTPNEYFNPQTLDIIKDDLFWYNTHEPTQTERHMCLYTCPKQDLAPVVAYKFPIKDEHTHDYLPLNKDFVVEISHLSSNFDDAEDVDDDLGLNENEFENTKEVTINVYQLDAKLRSTLLTDSLQIQLVIDFDFSVSAERISDNMFLVFTEDEQVKCFEIDSNGKLHQKPHPELFEAFVSMDTWAYSADGQHLIVPDQHSMVKVIRSFTNEINEGALSFAEESTDYIYTSLALNTADPHKWFACAIYRPLDGKRSVRAGVYSISPYTHQARLISSTTLNDPDAYVISIDETVKEAEGFTKHFAIGTSMGKIYTVSCLTDKQLDLVAKITTSIPNENPNEPRMFSGPLDIVRAEVAAENGNYSSEFIKSLENLFR